MRRTTSLSSEMEMVFTTMSWRQGNPSEKTLLLDPVIKRMIHTLQRKYLKLAFFGLNMCKECRRFQYPFTRICWAFRGKCLAESSNGFYCDLQGATEQEES